MEERGGGVEPSVQGQEQAEEEWRVGEEPRCSRYGYGTKNKYGSGWVWDQVAPE